jgi:alkanesulfonate monooxygenase SsuD/methylene tetrahydromethanopterin reductase-like flavin-dependent oxidoreductase (luciferase family)
MYCCEDPSRGWEEVKEHYLYMHNLYRRWYREAGDSNETELDRAEELPRNMYFVGTPEECARAIESLRQQIPFDEFIFWASPPGMSTEKTGRSVELFAREVIPRFR